MPTYLVLERLQFTRGSAKQFSTKSDFYEDNDKYLHLAETLNKLLLEKYLVSRFLIRCISLNLTSSTY